MSYFTTPANIEALALAIIPNQPNADAAVRAALATARQDLRDNLLTELGGFINTGLNSVFTVGTPTANDGGAQLQTDWKAETAS